MFRRHSSKLGVRNPSSYIVRIYSKTTTQAQYTYDINTEETNIVLIQSIFDHHNIGSIDSLLVIPASDTIEISFTFLNKNIYNNFIQQGFLQRRHICIPSTNIWIHKK